MEKIKRMTIAKFVKDLAAGKIQKVSICVDNKWLPVYEDN